MVSSFQFPPDGHWTSIFRWVSIGTCKQMRYLCIFDLLKSTSITISAVSLLCNSSSTRRPYIRSAIVVVWCQTNSPRSCCVWWRWIDRFISKPSFVFQKWWTLPLGWLPTLHIIFISVVSSSICWSTNISQNGSDCFHHHATYRCSLLHCRPSIFSVWNIKIKLES